MLEGILREIEEVECPDAEGTSTGIGLATSRGFEAAKEQIVAIIRAHLEDGRWISCKEGLPEEDGYYLCSFDEGSCAPVVSSNEYRNGIWRYGNPAAWQPLPSYYRPKRRAVGDGYRQRLMERFLKVE